MQLLKKCDYRPINYILLGKVPDFIFFYEKNLKK